MGGGKGSSTSVITHAEKIIAVAPYSVYEFPEFDFYNSEESLMPVFGYENCKVGTISKLNEPSTLEETPWQLMVTYSFDQDFSFNKQMIMGLYVSDIIAVPGIGWNGSYINTDRYMQNYNKDTSFYVYKSHAK